MPEKGGLEMMIIISVQERLITAVSMTCRLQYAFMEPQFFFNSWSISHILKHVWVIWAAQGTKKLSILEQLLEVFYLSFVGQKTNIVVSEQKPSLSAH